MASRLAPGEMRSNQGLSVRDDKDSFSNTRKQLYVLGLFPLSEHIAWSSSFPYIYTMVQSLGHPSNGETRPVAFYASLLVSCFTFGEFLMGPQWARISDAIGRKPTLLIGSLTAMFSAAAFGLSVSLPMALVARLFAGALNPNLGVLKTYVGELVSKEKQARGFSFISFMQGLGFIIGPVVGGFLAEPTRKMPAIFRPGILWDKFPYLLPNLVVVMCLAISCALGFVFLQEVHPSFRHQEDAAQKVLGLLWTRLKIFMRGAVGSRYTPLHTDDELELSERGRASAPGDSLLSINRREAFTRQVLLQILSVTLRSFLDIGTLSLVPIFLGSLQPSISTRNRTLAGGFGLNTEQTSTVLLSQAIASTLFQVFLIPQLIERQGALRSYRYMLLGRVIVYTLMPMSVILPGSGGLLAFLLMLWMLAFFSGTSRTATSMMITNNSPSPIHIATINGVAASCGCLAKTAAPALVGVLYDSGVKKGNIVMPFFILGAVAALTLGLTAVLQEHAHPD